LNIQQQGISNDQGKRTRPAGQADFVHKLKVALKELRETEIWLKVIQRAKMIKPSSKLAPLIRDND